MDKYVMEETAKQELIQCSTEGEKVCIWAKLLRHIDTKHSGKPKHVCNICEEQFERTDVLKKHQRFVHQIEPRKVILPGINENVNHFECYVCEVSFKEKYKLNRHLETMYNDNSDYLQKHSKTHIKIICEICLKHFESKDGLKAHRIGNHI